MDTSQLYHLGQPLSRIPFFAPTHPIIPTATIQEMLKAGVAGSIKTAAFHPFAADHHVLKKKTAAKK